MSGASLQIRELEARKMAHGCSVYSSTKDSYHDQRIKATQSAATSAACGDRWMALRSELKKTRHRAASISIIRGTH